MIYRRKFYGIFLATLLKSRYAIASFIPANLSPSFVAYSRMTTRKAVEVEQKFQLNETCDLDAKLISLGFVPKGTVRFVDWYFDTPSNDLSTNDLWLRYRDKGGNGQWELKVRKDSSVGTDSTTVYDEIEGDQACTTATDILATKGIGAKEEETESTFDGFSIPKLPPRTAGFSPFCRLETTRSSWVVASADSEYSGMQVDLDSTNTGHTVGEVETICSDSEIEIEKGKERVQQLVSILMEAETDSQGPAVGKLEHFLMTHRPEHYKACVASGVIKDKMN